MIVPVDAGADRSDIIIRQAREDDAGGIANVLNAIVEDGRFTVIDRTFSVEEERAFIRGFPERGLLLVALDAGGAVLGFQTVEPFASFTSAFDHVGVIGTFVRLDRRRQGIGARLFAETFARMPEHGFEKLFAYVRGDNPAALAAYERHGFRVIGTAKRQAKVRGRYVDEMMIEKLLDER